MKIGILSMQRIDNCGSVLQAYGLKKLLEDQGAEVFFIDIKDNEDEKKLIEGKRLSFSEDSNTGVSFLSKVINKIYWLLQAKKFEKFRTKYLEINKCNDNYDLCVIGSDEVFNCLNLGWWGFTSQLFGNVPEAKKVITYAASCGATQYEQLPIKVKDKIRFGFSNIADISVRDENTVKFVSHFSDKQATVNLDPVLIYDFADELKNVKLPKVRGKYCLIYAYANRIKRKEEYDSIIRFCKKKSLIPITVCTSQFWCRRHYICSPFETLKLFENADFVITDTFHGAIFSAKYAKRFAVLTRKSNYNKLTDLVKRIKIEKHLVNNLTQLDCVYDIEKDIDGISALINEERNKTKEYLGKYVNGETK